jgi:transposase-like protein
VSIAAIIATGVNQDGRREILGLGLGQSEAATFWIAKRIRFVCAVWCAVA